MRIAAFSLVPVLLLSLGACGGGRTPTYSVGGTSSGVAGSGLVLQLNGGDALGPVGDGSFVFSNRLTSGSAYVVTIKAQPAGPSQTCVLANASGTVVGANIASVIVTCTTNSYSAGGTVSGLAGSGLVVEFNGSIDLPLAADGAFVFPGLIASGAAYAVVVKAQPTYPFQTCMATNASGVVGAGPITNVAVTCTTNSYAVAGTVIGLSGAGLMLQINGGQVVPVAANGSFAFPTALPSGSAYVVTIKAQPATRRELCVAANAAGTIAGSNIIDVRVDCAIVLGFVYGTGSIANQVVTYGISSGTGALLPLGTPVATGSAPYAVAAAPSGNFLYVSNTLSNTVSIFAVDPSIGALTAAGAPVRTGSQPRSMAMTPSGKFLYVACTADGSVTTYAVNPATGALTADASPLAFGKAAGIELTVTPDSRFAYIMVRDLNTAMATVTAYSIDPVTGALTAGAVVTPSGDSTSPRVDPSGRFVYWGIDQSTPNNGAATLMAYSINANTGALTAIGTGTPAGGATALTIDPTGQYVYLISSLNAVATDDKITAFSIDQTSGALSQIGPPVLTGGAPSALACDPSGQFVYVANASPAAFNATFDDVSAYAIESAAATAGQVVTAGGGTHLSAVQSGWLALAIIE
jgi:6-phosphogluconolactonase (cycloisomerase 2 family)